IEGGETKKLADWWTTFESAGRDMRQAMANDLESGASNKPNVRRRRSPRNKKSRPES
ncbi:MAG: polynucleotide adenylyltransferase PcnB, partial [Vibrio sp.]|nr:polynucleotide adenylyltransferase PcnB [Vibrio sp.]